MKIFAILGFLYFTTTILKGQNIEIGQEAWEAKAIIESSTDEHNRIQHGGDTSTYWNWNYKLNNDSIIEIIQCYSNENVGGLGNISNYCTHYFFSHERLAYISAQFTDVDSFTIDKYLQDNLGKYKIGKNYFSNDYNYSIVIVNHTDFVSVEWRRAEWNDLSQDVQDTINKRILEEREIGQVNIQAEDNVRKRENEIKSKTYDLQSHDSAAYNLFINELRNSLTEGLKNYSMFPGWQEIDNDSDKCFVFKNSYEALCRIYDQSKLRSESEYLFLPDDGVFVAQNYFKLVSGNDTTCDLLKYFSPTLPSIKIEGYNVMTDAHVPDIDILYMKGITKVRINNGEVDYRKYLPPLEVRDLISQRLKKIRTGRYKVKYEAGMVMDSTFVDTNPEKLQSTVGAIATVSILTILFVGYYISERDSVSEE